MSVSEALPAAPDLEPPPCSPVHLAPAPRLPSGRFSFIPGPRCTFYICPPHRTYKVVLDSRLVIFVILGRVRNRERINTLRLRDLVLPLHVTKWPVPGPRAISGQWTDGPWESCWKWSLGWRTWLAGQQAHSTSSATTLPAAQVTPSVLTVPLRFHEAEGMFGVCRPGL